MKFSENWLRQWVNPDLDTDALVHQVTMSGLEVDGTEPAAGAFSNVVVARIVSAEPHPNADKLQVCQVEDGETTYQVVCGAPNARAGLKVALARVGGVLPGDFKIKKARLRDVDSAGMLCSGKELGLSDDHSGILELAEDAPVGIDLREYLALDDTLIDIDLTPNRADCLSIRGIARDVGALNDIEMTAPTIEPVPAVIEDTFPVTLSAPEACPRFLGRVIRGIDPSATTPLWMQERLRRSGVRSIDPVVDVTNYVMLELGHPMHGFDLHRLDGGIDVRWAKPGEQLTLLDEQTVTLREDTLVVADRSQVLSMAGIMGGEASGINDETSDIFLECAFFAPLHLAGVARSYGLHTDSSHRFERGVDFNGQRQAVERATQLLLDIVGGHPGPVEEALAPDHLPVSPRVSVSHQAIHDLLGADIPAEQITRIFKGLGFGVEVGEGEWHCAIPSHRFDISIPADLIEEVARVYGYNNLPVSDPAMPLAMVPLPEAIEDERLIKRRLLALGYQEAVTYSFVEPGLQKLLEPDLAPLPLANPISEDLSVMRTNLAAGLLNALRYNLNRQQDRVRLFEVGLVFRGQLDDLEQTKRLGGLLYGPRSDTAWLGSDMVHFYDLKGDVESLLALAAGNDIRFESLPDDPMLHPGQAARVTVNGEAAGWMGRLHPRIEQSLELKKPVYLFELELAQVAARQVPLYQPLSKYPGSHRDVAILVSEQVQAQQLQDAARTAGGEWLQTVSVFDVYAGEGIETGKRSVALQLSWQHPERTLQDEEVAGFMNAVIEQLQTQFDAALRS
ncbi:MAG: phenylalanine--tRNA ligase subunit beta [Natronospirillum sp.]|uniref:phenylalanine--tRNA ligase subunit beta n=1 Tax=Natronospirillum sp. TaxID=2812955 RepID=UPI0025F2B87C|nr:phenylalanine--tRNA ligase subunit beta [Natronospirillum sp.]MCH8552415.1 phenylalanine--tRNA ligase subunit beta [Natronospirillum sp.]